MNRKTTVAGRFDHYLAGYRRAEPASHSVPLSELVSNRLYIFSAWTFGTLAHFILDHLPFTKLLDRNPDQGRVVKEDVSAFSFDKSESFVCDYLFDLALGHHVFLSKMLVNP